MDIDNDNDNSANSHTDRSRSRRKKKRSVIVSDQSQYAQAQQHQHSSRSSSSSSSGIDRCSNWKSQSQQRIYSTKLLSALRHVAVGPRRGGAVREAADRALAVTAKGATRWSRAILSSRLKLKFRMMSKKRILSPSARVSTSTGSGRSSKKHMASVYRLKFKNLPAVQRKAKVLGRLVPGCRRESLPVILDEVKDYIPALEMQIRALSDLVNRLTASASGSAQPNPST